MKCTKCGYERKLMDISKDPDCPRCGFVDNTVNANRTSDDARLDAGRPDAPAPRPPRAGPPVITACPDCSGLVSTRAVVCPHCGRPFEHRYHAVSVMDIRMRFESMVWFMVKWILATIPAVIILALVGWFLLMLIRR